METKTLLMNGKECQVPVEPDGTVTGESLYRYGQVPAHRTLVLQREDGTNTVVNPHQRTVIRPGDHCTHVPHLVRGA